MTKKIYPKNPGVTNEWVLEGALAEEDLAALCQRKNLRQVTFRNVTHFPERPFRYFSTQKGLRFVTLDHCPLSPGDMSDLALIAKLQHLYFIGCPVTDQDTPSLRGHPTVDSLWLNGSNITDNALIPLGEIPKLQWLDLEATNVTDQGLSHLRTALRLTTLNLSNTMVTDDGILQLAVLPKLNLKEPFVKGTRVTRAGLDALFAERKRLKKISVPLKGMVNIDADEVAAATKALYGYFRAMHDWEVECYRRVMDEKFDAVFDEARESCRRIFAEYCTVKNRAFGRPENISIGSPSQYFADPSTETITDIESPSKGRLVIETQQHGTLLNYRCQYVLLKKHGRWLIDSRKTWGNGWEQSIL